MMKLLCRPMPFSIGTALGAVLTVAGLAGLSVSFAAEKIVAPDAASQDRLGTSVAIDGDLVAVGAPRADQAARGAGIVRLQERAGDGSWNEIATLLASDAARYDEFGSSVAIAGDMIVVGAPKVNEAGRGNSGAVYVFTRNGQSWIETARLAAASPQSNGLFGTSVGIDGGTITVGAPGHATAGGSRAGEVFVYVPDGAGWTEQATLTPSDAAAQQVFGESVAITGDTVLVGAPQSVVGGATNAGAAYLFTRSGGLWSQSEKLTASDADAGDRFGGAVDIDGGVAVAGSRLADPSGSNSGAAYVFESASGWSETALLEADDGSGGDMFGIAVAVDDDVVAVGAVGYDTSAGGNVGAAYQFARNGGSWQQAAVYTASDGASNDSYGTAVALSSDVLVVGANRDDEPDAGGTIRNDAGSAYIIDLLGDVVAPDWGDAALVSGEITPTSIELIWDAASDDVGVAGYLVYRDGAQIADVTVTTLVVTGLTPDTTYPFTVEAYDAAGNTTTDGPSASFSTTSAPGDAEAPQWTNGTLAASNETETTIDVSWSGASDNVAVAGYRVYDDSGSMEQLLANVADGGATGATLTGLTSATTYQLRAEAYDAAGSESTDGPTVSATTATTTGGAANETIVRPSGLTASDEAGESVAIENDRAVVASRRANGQRGTLAVYERSGGAWSEVARLNASDASGGDNLGFGGDGVAISGSTVLAGAWHADPVAGNSGAAYVFVEGASGAWTEQQKLVPQAGEAGATFGRAVALSGNVAVIGAPEHDGAGGVNSGRVYVFERSGGTWTETAVLEPQDGSAAQRFGYSVAIDGMRLAIGARGDGELGGNAGAAYVFEKVGGTWTERQKLQGTDTSTGDRFGESVALSGGVVVAGAPREDQGASSTGAAYVFEYDGATWQQSAKLFDMAGAGGLDEFGVNVAVSGTAVLVGAHQHDASASNGGAAYLYGKSGVSWVLLGEKLLASDASNDARFGRSVSLSGGTALIGANTAGKAYFVEVDTSAPGDTQAPQWTSGMLSASSQTETTIDVSWSGASDNVAVAGYRVYDDSGSSSELLVNVADGGATGVTLTGLTSATTYQLRVEAYDAVGLESNDGPAVAATTMSGGGGGGNAPTWPSGQLSVVAVTASSATFGWSGAADDEAVTGYRLFDNNGAVIDEVTTTSYTATGLSVNDLYHVRVEAYDAGGNLSTDGPAFGGRFPFDKVVAPQPGDDELFGGALAIDGNTALITALHTDLPVNGSLKQKVGKAYIYARQGIGWQLEAELVADDGFTSDLFGYDADLDGDVAIIGAWRANPGGVSDAGAAYLFRRSGDTWTQEQKLVASSPQADAEFGVGVAVQGDLAAVGAHEADVGAFTKAGTVTVFERDGGAWNAVATLSADTPQTDQSFGRSVAIDGGRIVVGAAREDVPGAPVGGALYVFEQSGGTWTQSARLVTDDVSNADVVGIDVAIDGDTIVTVARDDDLGSNAGAGYVFEYDGSNWGQQAKLLAPDGAAGDFLAFRGAISGDLAAFGAFRHDLGSASDAGAVYVFRRSNGTWQPLSSQSKFTATDAATDDHYGIAVAIDGTTLMVGSELDDLPGPELDAFVGVPDGTNAATTDSGSVWFYDLDLN